MNKKFYNSFRAISWYILSFSATAVVIAAFFPQYLFIVKIALTCILIASVLLVATLWWTKEE